MPDTEDEDIAIPENPATPPSVSPLLANVISLHNAGDLVLMDFGFLAPSYVDPYDLEDTHIARICLNLQSAKHLSKQLSKLLSDKNKESKKRKERK